MSGSEVTDEKSLSDVTPASVELPLFSVVKGKPTDEELVAMVAVLTATSGGATPISKPVPSAWTAYGRATRTRLVPGAGAWNASARR